MHLIAITEIPNPFKSKDEKTHQNSSAKHHPRDILKFCEDLAGEPEADYPSDDEMDEEEEDERRKLNLMERIENVANQGVEDNLRDSRRNVGRSLRDTRMFGSSTSPLSRTVNDPNFQRNVANILSRTQIKKDENRFDGDKGFKPNVLRHRGGKTQSEQDRKSEPVRRFGHTTPIFSDFMEKIQERNLESHVSGMERTGGNLARTYRPNASDDYHSDDDPLYDEIPAAVGTLGRKFYKKLQKVSKQNVRFRGNDEIELRSRPNGGMGRSGGIDRSGINNRSFSFDLEQRL